MNVAAFDPGQNVGFALLDTSGTLLRRDVLAFAELAVFEIDADVVVVGDGTGSADVVAALAARGFVPEVQDETGTTLEGRRLYFRDHPAVGLMRIVPVGMRSPPRPIDDYAAYAIGLRWLARRGHHGSGGPGRTR